MEKVAVMVSCYNHKKFVKQCIDSILDQTYQDFRIYFWDNNSTDGSWDFVEKEYEDILITKMFMLKVGLGGYTFPIGISRHTMVTSCPESYTHIAIVDADDYWHPEKLEKQMKLFNGFNENVKLVFSDCYYNYYEEVIEQHDRYPVSWTSTKYGKIGDKTFHDRFPPFYNSRFFNLLTRYNFMPCCSLVFDRKALLSVIGNPEAYTSAEDYDWILKMTARYDSAFVPEPLAYYRIHSDQITKSTPARCTAEEIDVVKSNIYLRELTKAQKKVVRKHLCILYLKLLIKEFFGLYAKRR